MKKISSLILTLIVVLGCFTLTGCRDPLESKIRELDNAYIRLGEAYYNAVEACAFSDVYEEGEIADKFVKYKKTVKAAKKEKAAYLDYDEGQMDELIAKWDEVTAELNALTEKYQYVPERDGYVKNSNADASDNATENAN